MGAARDASSLPERERERGFTRERERDPAAPAPLPGHVNKEVEKTWPGNENEDHASFNFRSIGSLVAIIFSGSCSPSS